MLWSVFYLLMQLLVFASSNFCFLSYKGNFCRFKHFRSVDKIFGHINVMKFTKLY